MGGDKKRMAEFIAERLKASGLYAVQAVGEDVVRAEEREGERRQVRVALYAERIPLSSAMHANSIQRAAGQYTAHVFYQDSEEFFRPLSEREKQHRKSLKCYAEVDVDSMVKLSDLEYYVMRLYPAALSELTYYRPQAEAIVGYRMEAVNLDRSHLRPGDNGYGYAHDQPAIRYRLPREKVILGRRSPAQLRCGAPEHRRALLRLYAPQLELAFGKVDEKPEEQQLTRDEAAEAMRELARRLS